MPLPDPLPIEIDPKDLAELRDGGGDYALLDVREDWEVALFGFPEAIHIPLSQLETRAGELPRDRPLVAICRTGRRSLAATEFLRRRSFASATNLRRGIHGWSEDVDPSAPRY